jgi:hypothetical protein
MTKHCIRCNAKLLAENAKYCHECGAPQISPDNALELNIGGDVRNSQVANAGRDVNIHKIGDEKALRQCNVCKGEGKVEEWITCSTCGGKGIIYFDPPKRFYGSPQYDHCIDAVGCVKCGGSGNDWVDRDRKGNIYHLGNSVTAGKGKICIQKICTHCHGQGVVRI